MNGAVSVAAVFSVVWAILAIDETCTVVSHAAEWEYRLTLKHWRTAIYWWVASASAAAVVLFFGLFA